MRNYQEIEQDEQGRTYYNFSLMPAVKQCPAELPNGDGILCCTFVEGHEGLHKTCYTIGQEWISDAENIAALQHIRAQWELEDKLSGGK